jgi:hypothetical protein
MDVSLEALTRWIFASKLRDQIGYPELVDCLLMALDAFVEISYRLS